MVKKGDKDKKKGPASIQNKRARFEYNILNTYEAGLVLVGSEVKSIYLGQANLTDAHCRVKNNELWIINLDIDPYEFTSHFAPERRRDRKLLLKKKEIETIDRKSREKGLSIIPLKMYFNIRGRVKVEIALAQGKKLYDKRTQIAERETRREQARVYSDRH